jgi:hypothetical protein
MSIIEVAYASVCALEKKKKKMKCSIFFVIFSTKLVTMKMLMTNIPIRLYVGDRMMTANPFKFN